jgi:hypothetical protein
VGEGGIFRASERPSLSATRTAYLRLLLVCAAFAGGQTGAWALGASPVGTLVGAVLGAAAFVLTQDLERPRPGRGEIRYWRGRRVDDDDDGPRRWN